MSESKVVAVRFGDVDIQIRDLALDEITDIARRNATEWFMVVDSPTFDLGVAKDVLVAAARHADVDPPPFKTGRDAISVIREFFVLVDDDLPELPVVKGDGDENPTDAG